MKGRRGVPRAVLDTSAILYGERRRSLYYASAGYFVAVWSPYVVAEVARIFIRKCIQSNMRYDEYRGRMNAFIREVSSYIRCVDHRPVRTSDYAWLRDRDDAEVLATALAGQATYLVSRNTKHFPDAHLVKYPSGERYHGSVRYLEDTDFIRVLKALNPTKDLDAEFLEADYRLP